MNIAEICFDNGLRAEEIHWLACQADQYTDGLRGFFSDCDRTPAEFTALFGGAVVFTEKELSAMDGLRGSDLDDHVGGFMSRLYLARKRGFLVKIGTPVPHSFSEDGGANTGGFGHVQWHWFYTEALDEEFITRALEWQETFYATERRKLEAKKKPAKKKGKAVTSPAPSV